MLDALPEELMKVKGMGEHSVVLLKLIPAVTGRYLEGRTGPGTIIHTAAEAGHVLAPYFYGARNEMVYVLCLDAKEKLLGVKKISEGNNTNSDVTIRRVAEEQSCIIMGRCADFVLSAAGVENLVRLFVYADSTTCIRRVMEVDGVDTKEALRRVNRISRQRRDYYKYYTGRDWEDMGEFTTFPSTRLAWNWGRRSSW